MVWFVDTRACPHKPEWCDREYIGLCATSLGYTLIHPGTCTTTLHNYLVCITVGKPCTDTSTLSCCTQQVLYERSRTLLSLTPSLSLSPSLPSPLSFSSKDLLCLRSCRSKYNTSTTNYLLVFSSSTLPPKYNDYYGAFVRLTCVKVNNYNYVLDNY